MRERILAFGGWGQRSTGRLPEATEAEELANSLTGGVGLVASLLGLAFLIQVARSFGEAEYLISAAIYGLTLVFSFGATTMYHGARRGPRKERLRVLDHCAVYALIAGSYTPIALVGLEGRTGWGLLASVWVLAALGILFKLRFRFRFPGTSILIYLALGWLGIFTIEPVIDALGMRAFLLLASGGIAYTIGTIFFGAKRLPHNHAVWHLLVILGCSFNYAAITIYVLVPTA